MFRSRWFEESTGSALASIPIHHSICCVISCVFRYVVLVYFPCITIQIQIKIYRQWVCRQTLPSAVLTCTTFCCKFLFYKKNLFSFFKFFFNKFLLQGKKEIVRIVREYRRDFPLDRVWKSKVFFSVEID